MLVQIKSASLDFLYLGNDDKAFRIDQVDIFLNLDELTVGNDSEHHVQLLVQITTLNRNDGCTTVDLSEYKIAECLLMIWTAILEVPLTISLFMTSV